MKEKGETKLKLEQSYYFSVTYNYLCRKIFIQWTSQNKLNIVKQSPSAKSSELRLKPHQSMKFVLEKCTLFMAVQSDFILMH